MKLRKSEIVNALADQLVAEPTWRMRGSVIGALDNGVVKNAIREVRQETGNIKQLYGGETLDLIFDVIERRIGNADGIKVGHSGCTLTKVHLAQAYDEAKKLEFGRK